MQNLDIDTMVKGMLDDHIIEAVSGEGGYDGYRVTDMRFMAVCVIAEVTGITEIEVTDTDQIERVTAAMVSRMWFNQDAKYWLGVDYYESDDTAFVEAAVQAV